MDIENYLRIEKEKIDIAIEKYLPCSGPLELIQAMRYSVLDGGKRIRPILTLSVVDMLEGKREDAIPFACAIELIHCFTLIHDDLPSMDNDDYRRGKPSTHRAFGEDMAILSGDALLNHAFEVMSNPEARKGLSDEKVLRIIHEISQAIGVVGVVGGQSEDVRINERTTLEELEKIYRKKTASLIRVSVRTGAIIAEAGEREMAFITRFGEELGIAFQIIDDILGATGRKERGGDEEERRNYTSILGVEEARNIAIKRITEAKRALSSFGERARILKGIADYILKRAL